MNLHVQTRLTRCALDFDRAREGRALALVVQGGSGPVVLMWQDRHALYWKPRLYLFAAAFFDCVVGL